MGVLRGMSAVSGARHGKGSFYNYTMPRASSYSSFSSPKKMSYVGSRVTKSSFIHSNSRTLRNTVVHPGLKLYKAPVKTKVIGGISKGLHGFDRQYGKLSRNKKDAIILGAVAAVGIGIHVGAYYAGDKLGKAINKKIDKKFKERAAARKRITPSAQNTQRPAQRTVKQGNHAKGIHQRHKRTFFARDSKGHFR